MITLQMTLFISPISFLHMISNFLAKIISAILFSDFCKIFCADIYVLAMQYFRSTGIVWNHVLVLRNGFNS